MVVELIGSAMTIKDVFNNINDLKKKSDFENMFSRLADKQVGYIFNKESKSSSEELLESLFLPSNIRTIKNIAINTAPIRMVEIIYDFMVEEKDNLCLNDTSNENNKLLDKHINAYIASIIEEINNSFPLIANELYISEKLKEIIDIGKTLLAQLTNTSSNNKRDILSRIIELNVEFKSSFAMINNEMIHRIETDNCFRSILDGESLLIHGKAGYGKSGCVQELALKFEQENIPYLALKLDVRIPKNTAKIYGRKMDLPNSPVLCLDAIANNCNSVLILDQLDALGWTNNRSSTSFTVVKEIIRQVNNINRYSSNKMSIIFVCRTFDIENDSGLKSLINSDDEEDIKFVHYPINELDELNVKQTIGEDAFSNLSTELISLLRVPNNLYIWTMLSDENKKISYKTSVELIRQWWEQLIDSYKVGDVNDVNSLKKYIVEERTKRGINKIPKIMFRDFSLDAIKYLISNGLLNGDEHNIGFVHQSYYDYFIVEDKIIQVFNNQNIIDIVGTREQQTPHARYQMQMVLEYLLCSDVERFIEFGKELTGSEEVRFYIKFVFLEVLSQVNKLHESIIGFIEEYINNEYWFGYLIDVVFFNHVLFTGFLIDNGYISNWIESDDKKYKNIAFNLLRAISKIIPDKVVRVLKPYAFKDNDIDNYIYSTLNRDIKNDSELMFEFRLQLLNKNPMFIKHFLWKDLARYVPFRAIKLIELIIRTGQINSNNLIQKQVLNEIYEQVKTHAKYIWENFMPHLSESTLDAIDKYDIKVKPYIIEKYMRNNIGRAYVEIIKAAAKALIVDDIVDFLDSCEDYYNKKSIVVNEVMLSIMYSLPASYSNYAINWILENPQHRLFDYTSENNDYLFSSKKVIEKHSQTCSEDVFLKLEEVLYYYHSEDEIEGGKRRFQYNKENRIDGNKLTYYWAYWGEVQRYLLSSLESSRVSKKTKELIKILDRKFKEDLTYYRRYPMTGGAIRSTIHDNADKISDKKWLDIVNNKDLKDDRGWRGGLKESSHRQFSTDLEIVGMKNPSRFIRLSLDFPDSINSHYVRALYNIINVGLKDNNLSIDFNIIQQLIVKHMDMEVTQSFCRLISDNTDKQWNTDILNIISTIAKECSNPREGEMNVISNDDEESVKVESLQLNAINCGRGVAASAIADLIWRDNKYYDFFKDDIESLVNDTHLAVNVAVMHCVAAVTNIDKEQAFKWFMILANKDLRIVSAQTAHQLFNCYYQEHEDSIKDIIKLMFESEYEDVMEVGAKHISNMYLLHDIFGEEVFKKDNNIIQKKNIVSIAIELLNQPYHDKCKNVIMHYINDECMNENVVHLTNYIDIDKDIDLLVELSKNNQVIESIDMILFFIKENDVDLERFAYVIFESCENIAKNKDENTLLYGISSELSSLIVDLYDKTKGNYEVNQKCLDMLDLMFEKRIVTVRDLTNSLVR